MNVNLDRRIRIESRTITKGTHGAPVETWAVVDTVWAELRDVAPSRSEAVKLGMKVATRQTRCRIRYRAGLDSSMRVVWDGANYGIVGGPAEIGRREYLELVLERTSVVAA